MTVDSNQLRAVMRKWATGVTVVTARQDNIMHGMTVSSFTSISLEPPLVLVSLETDTQTHAMVKKSGHFGVTILSQEQETISDRFAGRLGDGDDRFAGLETKTLVSRAPFLAGGLAYLDCEVVSSFTAGTHTVFIARVLAAQENDGGQPLLYYCRGYRQLG